MTVPKQVLALTIFAYKKDGMTDQEYRDYMVNVHAPMARELFVKHGIHRWSMTHHSEESRKQMERLAGHGPLFQNVIDYDCVIQVLFDDLEDFLRLKEDPEYATKAGPDHANFANAKRTTMTIGYVTDVVANGVVV